MIRVLLAEDHAMVRAGLESLLASVSDIEVVGSVADGAAAVALARTVLPDVVLMDLTMPVLDGVRATAALMAAHPDVKVVILTGHPEQDLVRAALESGAIGYLLKDVDPDDVVGAIRAAARGEAPLDPRAATALLPSRSDPTPAALTAREREVLDLLAAGLANKQIARRLGISEKTVKCHLTRVYETIGVTDRTQAALWAAARSLAI